MTFLATLVVFLQVNPIFHLSNNSFRGNTHSRPDALMFYGGAHREGRTHACRKKTEKAPGKTVINDADRQVHWSLVNTGQIFNLNCELWPIKQTITYALRICHAESNVLLHVKCLKYYQTTIIGTKIFLFICSRDATFFKLDRALDRNTFREHKIASVNKNFKHYLVYKDKY